MYAYLWRSLPGPRPVKVVLVLLVLAAVFLLLMEVVFPWVAQQLPHTDVTV
ncbi:hypothetical protein SAMN06265174_102295 [Dietzia kunjamensis subsp. schimae]|jgi:hypothetical protein|uniref:Uncharacterized protein n=2 Tax=Dietzia TaxID=37914 RepID=A0AAE4QYF0_9ACTN|nr:MULTISPECIES: hypothetical protein [Dietzia]MBB1012975.1 hypothetical protein [Dietzia kunjamensis]MDN4505055.1 hypothetical protein [Dietzia maris]MDV6299508.1 hypothetical protein [Dietzia maris]RKE65397.1 hypothetical protein BXY47_1556 [Dietzia kunjamensis]USX46323.1 hypothetical protein NHB83_02140 [Dietzia kunjamensis]